VANGRAALLRFSPDGRLVAAAVGAGTTVRRVIRQGVAVTERVSSGGKLQVLEWATGTPRFEWPAEGQIQAAAFSPDGGTLAVGWPDTAVLFFDATGAAGPRPWEQSPTDPGKLWAKLSAGDGEEGWAAMRELIARPDVAVPLVKDKVKPAETKPRPTADELAAIIARLDAPAFAAREAAGRALRDLGPVAGPAVRRALRETASTEARQRLGTLAEGLNRPPAVNVAEVRAVEVLERIGSGAAKDYLASLAAGEPTAELTKDAAAAIKRLAARSRPQ
jgi:hypothetical protein